MDKNKHSNCVKENMNTVKNSIKTTCFAAALVLAIPTTVYATEPTACNTYPVTESADTNYVTFDEDQQFSQFEEIINSNLSILNNKYIYTEEERTAIEAAIYDFDIKGFNSRTGNNYTSESLRNEIFYRINTANLEAKAVMPNNGARSCNRVYTESGWNYTRFWTDHAGTVQWGNELVDRATLDGGLDLGSSFFGPGGVALSVAFTIHGAYCSGLAYALAANDTGCGVRTDINSYYAAYTVVDQRTV